MILIVRHIAGCDIICHAVQNGRKREVSVLAPADASKQVNRGETTFAKEYREVSEKYLELLQYGPEDPFAYGYNDACTAFRPYRG